jgi:hypothetical protein
MTSSVSRVWNTSSLRNDFTMNLPSLHTLLTLQTFPVAFGAFSSHGTPVAQSPQP